VFSAFAAAAFVRRFVRSHLPSLARSKQAIDDVGWDADFRANRGGIWCCLSAPKLWRFCQQGRRSYQSGRLFFGLLGR
jgi:hypothetical protein